MTAASIHTFPFLFFSDGVRLHGTLHRNVNDLHTPQPSVVISGSWLTVKEQMADRYARELASRGFSAFTFDFAGFGQSAGEPRQTELPTRKSADIRAATVFVRSLSCTQYTSVGYLGVCASAQYALAAIARGASIASFVSVAGWFHDAPSIAPFYGGSEGVERRMQRGRSALDTYVSSGATPMVPAYADGDERAGMYFPLDYYANRDRGRVAEWRNEMSEMSWLYWLTFDGIRAASSVSTPTLIVHGDGCALPDNARRVHAELRGPKQLLWMEGSQVDFYDQPALVTASVDAAVEHFRNTLR
jgi:hypothetical protein